METALSKGCRPGDVMRFVSTRSLRNQPGTVKDLIQREDLVLTANGEPIGILVGVRGAHEEVT